MQSGQTGPTTPSTPRGRFWTTAMASTPGTGGGQPGNQPPHQQQGNQPPPQQQGQPPPQQPGNQQPPQQQGQPQAPAPQQLVMTQQQLEAMFRAMGMNQAAPTVTAPRVGGTDDTGAWTGKGSGGGPKSGNCYR